MFARSQKVFNEDNNIWGNAKSTNPDLTSAALYIEGNVSWKKSLISFNLDCEKSSMMILDFNGSSLTW